MTSAEYQQLVDFLGREFTRIDRRFETIDGQLGELRRDVLGHFDELYRRIERLDPLQSRIETIEQRLGR